MVIFFQAINQNVFDKINIVSVASLKTETNTAVVAPLA